MKPCATHSTVPTSLPPYTEADGMSNVLKLYAGNAVDVVIQGTGSVTAYVWCEPIGWRKHPSGIDLVDDDSYHRLIMGRIPEPTLRYLLFQCSGSASVYAQEVEY